MATILVVDDEIGIRELLSEILGDEGHAVLLAENASQARTLRDQANIARHCEPKSCPDRDAIDAANNRLVAALADRQQEMSNPAQIIKLRVLWAERRGALLHCEIEASAERVPGAGDGDNPDIVVPGRVVDCVDDGPGKLIRQCVFEMRPVQRHRAHMTPVGDCHQIRHRVLS